MHAKKIINFCTLKKVIVINVGNFMTRAGFGGSEEPRIITSSIIRTKNDQSYIRNKVCENHGLYDMYLTKIH